MADSSTFLPLVSVALGGVIAAGAGFITTWWNGYQQRKRDALAHEHQRERDRLAHERAQRAAQAERLRSAYRPILKAAQVMQAIMTRVLFMLEGETTETRDSQLNAMYRESMQPAQEALLEIALEQVPEEVRRLFARIQSTFEEYMVARRSQVEFPGTYSPQQMGEQRQIIIDAVQELTDIMQQHLRQLEHEHESFQLNSVAASHIEAGSTKILQ